MAADVVTRVIDDRPLDLAVAPVLSDGIPETVQDTPVHGAPATVAFKTGWVYSTFMMLHAEPKAPDSPDDVHPERPERIAAAAAALTKHGCVARMRRIQPREVLREEVALVHDVGLYEGLLRSQFFSRSDLFEATRLFGERSSLYINEHSFQSARISCGGVIELCDAVCSGLIRTGNALVRPPGHHAEPDRSMGFCFFNNVAVAVKWIKEKYGGDEVPHEQKVRRVLILDWDVHHGNGTQRAFEDDDEVLYISLHRYDNGDFYPGGTYGASASVGSGKGKGFSVNIPWPCSGMGDGEYIYAFHQIVMPVAAEFAPDLVVISAGFDAAWGDPLGGCQVTPTGYAQMTWMLMGLANGKVIVALEGGYSVDALAMSALDVTRTLLGDPVPAHEPLQAATTAAVDAIRLVKRDLSSYWSCIESNPLDPHPQIEAGLPKYSMSELLRAHRQTTVAKKYGLCELPVVGENLEQQWQSHALCSADLLDKDPPHEAIVVFAHDMGSLRAGNEQPSLSLVPDAEAGYLIDSSSLVLDWITRRGFAVVDVNLFPSPKSNLGRRRRGIDENFENASEFLEFLWDNYLDLVACPNIIVIAHAGAAKPVLSLLSSRRLDQDPRLVAASVTMGHEAVPLVSAELRKWYLRNGRVFLPESHPWWTQDAEKRRQTKRAGKIVCVHETRPIQVLRSALDDVITFLESKLAAKQQKQGNKGEVLHQEPAGALPAKHPEVEPLAAEVEQGKAPTVSPAEASTAKEIPDGPSTSADAQADPRLQASVGDDLMMTSE